MAKLTEFKTRELSECKLIGKDIRRLFLMGPIIPSLRSGINAFLTERSKDWKNFREELSPT
jgi:hypothetical protein